MEYTVESKDLLEAQSHVSNHIFNFINSMSLKCAVELGIPDAVHSNGGKPVSFCELANKLSIPSTRIDDLRRLMRLLVHSGFFTSQKIEKGVGDGKRDVELFLPTINSSLLLKENDISVSPFVLAMLDRIFALPWHSLGEWFRQSMVPTAFEIAHGDHLWGVTNKNASFGDSFNEGMASDASLVGKLVATAPRAAAAGASCLQRRRCGFTLEFHVPLTVTYALLNLLRSEEAGVHEETHQAAQWILHDWSDEDCVKHNFSSIYVLMMVVTSGKQRNEKEWNKLFTDAGYKEYKILNALGLRSVIEVYY
ncbi:trans-resveratrol di-O-methyltransferase-like [Ananas comosus]|uniref:Trans-resveratrol di-O-methyltransferase-like n=1 Tax=Ananas comosus TaxID=4615 RepID=A0A6P5EN49_ANACO|nr:trans-resveratrol di-O-methyltransferase-like [Ananas comosus]